MKTKIWADNNYYSRQAYESEQNLLRERNFLSQHIENGYTDFSINYCRISDGPYVEIYTNHAYFDGKKVKIPNVNCKDLSQEAVNFKLKCDDFKECKLNNFKPFNITYADFNILRENKARELVSAYEGWQIAKEMDRMAMKSGIKSKPAKDRKRL